MFADADHAVSKIVSAKVSARSLRRPGSARPLLRLDRHACNPSTNAAANGRAQQRCLLYGTKTTRLSIGTAYSREAALLEAAVPLRCGHPETGCWSRGRGVPVGASIEVHGRVAAYFAKEMDR